jgi:Ni/Co efflux regulator RcnB
MKRLILSAVALSMLALPVAQAQAGPRYEEPRYERQDRNDWRKPGYDRKDVYRKNVYRKKVVKKHWASGNRVPEWQRRQVVRDYNRHGLRRPGHGQHWVKVDNDYLLISIASGLIGGIIAAQR